MSDFYFKKSLGQNFLIDSNIKQKIVSSTTVKDKIIVEIGPGSGNLTEFILKEQPKHLYCIEKDARLIDDLKIKFKDFSNLTILNEDAMKFDFSFFQKEKITIIANLPYNVGTRIVVNLFKYNFIEECVLMLQKEVVEKFCEKSGSKEFNILSALCLWFGSSKKLFDVSENCFVPRPRIKSSVFKISFFEKENQKMANYDGVLGFFKVIFASTNKNSQKIFKNLQSQNINKNLINAFFKEDLLKNNVKVNKIIADFFLT